MQRKNLSLILVAVLALSLAGLACGTGYRTSYKIIGNSGEIRVQMKETEGTETNSLEINEDYNNQRVSATVTLSVETGSCWAVIRGEGGTIISLEAAAGSPGQAAGELVTDAFGEVDLETTCSGAQNLDLLIKFTR